MTSEQNVTRKVLRCSGRRCAEGAMRSHGEAEGIRLCASAPRARRPVSIPDGSNTALDPMFYKDLRAEALESAKKIRNAKCVFVGNKADKERMTGIVYMDQVGDEISTLTINLPDGTEVGFISTHVPRLGD